MMTRSLYQVPYFELTCAPKHALLGTRVVRNTRCPEHALFGSRLTLTQD